MVGSTDYNDTNAVLRTQLYLVHSQLVFERHKRDLYVKRNRRLLRSVINTQQLKEETDAMVGLQILVLIYYFLGGGNPYIYISFTCIPNFITTNGNYRNSLVLLYFFGCQTLRSIYL